MSICIKIITKEFEVCALTVVAEDKGLEENLVRLKEDKCEGYSEQKLLQVHLVSWTS